MRRSIFWSLSPTILMNTHKNIYLCIFTSISTKVIGKFKSSEHYLHISLVLTPVCQQRGVCDLTGRGSGRGLLRRLSRDHMACVRSAAHMRACVRVSCPCDHQAGQRPHVVVSFPLSFPLSRSHFCIHATTS